LKVNAAHDMDEPAVLETAKRRYRDEIDEFCHSYQDCKIGI
jgi:hypothetical protein